MPVTAKLSRKFYDKLGDDVANELVEGFNLVDATYRSDLRELNELNFARFDAKVEQRWAQLDAKLEQRVAQVEQRLTQLEAKFEQRLTQLEAKFEQRLTQLETKLEQRLAQLDTRFTLGLAEMETRLTKRMFGFWIAQAATTAALVLGVVKLVGH